MMVLVVGSMRYRVVLRWLGTQIDPKPGYAAAGAPQSPGSIEPSTSFGRSTPSACDDALILGSAG
jgi:hypothetical protein